MSTHPDFKVYYPQYLTTKLNSKGRYFFRKYACSRLKPEKNKLTHKEIAKNPGKYVMIVRPSIMDFLKKIKASKANVITSISRYNESKEVALFDWVSEMSYKKEYIILLEDGETIEV